MPFLRNVAPFIKTPYKFSVAQKLFAGGYYAFGAFLDPTRGDFVAGLGDVTGENAAQSIVRKMRLSESGLFLLKEKPLLNCSNLVPDDLKQMEEGSLGRLYLDYMEENGFSADERDPVHYIRDPNAAYAVLRYRQVHDFWHVLCGLPPTVCGEVALKWFEWCQTGLPSCAASALAGPMRLTSRELVLLREVYIPWAVRSAWNSEYLLSIRIENHLQDNVENLRYKWKVEPAPPLK